MAVLYYFEGVIVNLMLEKDISIGGLTGSVLAATSVQDMNGIQNDPHDQYLFKVLFKHFNPVEHNAELLCCHPADVQGCVNSQWKLQISKEPPALCFTVFCS